MSQDPTGIQTDIKREFTAIRAEVKIAAAEMKSYIIKRMFGAMAVQICVIIAAVKLLH